MAERSKAAVLKTVVSLVAPRVRIPISPPLFFWKGARVADWAPLLREWILWVPWVRIPSFPPFLVLIVYRLSKEVYLL